MRPYREFEVMMARCLACGYVRRGWMTDRCPECGHTRREALSGALMARRRRIRASVALLSGVTAVSFMYPHACDLYREFEGPYAAWSATRRATFDATCAVGVGVLLIGAVAAACLLARETCQADRDPICRLKKWALIGLAGAIHVYALFDAHMRYGFPYHSVLRLLYGW